MYAAMFESWPGSGIVVSYKNKGFEECLGNVMTFNSLLIIYGMTIIKLVRGTRIDILESRNRRAHGVDMRFCTYKYGISFGFRIHFIIFNRSSTW